MKIAVIAANGRSGRVFVEQALAKGHSVRAGVHTANPFEAHQNLEVVMCDATKQRDVDALVGGQDAVVSFIGHIKGSPARVQTEAMRTLVRAMQKAGVSRVVSLTGTGVRFPGDRVPLIDRFLNLGIGIVDPNRVQDGIEHVRVLRESDLRWTVLRVLKLQNTKPTAFVLNRRGVTKLFVSREEVARAALEVLEHDSFIQEAPILSKPAHP